MHVRHQLTCREEDTKPLSVVLGIGRKVDQTLVGHGRQLCFMILNTTLRLLSLDDFGEYQYVIVVTARIS